MYPINMLSASLAAFSQNLDNFFVTRIDLIKENKYPIMLITDPPCQLVIHIVPQQYQDLSLDIKNFEKPEHHFIPLGEASNTIICDFNFDGALFITSVHAKHAYTQIFRNGITETVVSLTHFADDKRECFLPIIKLQKSLESCLRKYLELLSQFHVPGPYYLYFHLLSSEGIKIDPRDIIAAKYEGKGRNKPLTKDELFFPPYKIEQAGGDMHNTLLPFFDILWNTFGFKGAPE